MGKEPTQRTAELRHEEPETKMSYEHLNPGYQDFVPKMTQVCALFCLRHLELDFCYLHAFRRVPTDLLL